MKPEIVTQAPEPPGQCLLSGDVEGPWIDTSFRSPWQPTGLGAPYGYLSVKYIEGLATEVLGMVPGDTIEILKEQLASYEERIQELQAFVDSSVEYQDAREKELA